MDMEREGSEFFLVLITAFFFSSKYYCYSILFSFLWMSV